MTYYDFYPRRPVSAGVSATTGIRQCGCPYPPYPPAPEPPTPPYIPVPGSQGPQGPQGPIGPQGPVGPQGPAGTTPVTEAIQAQLTGGASVAVGAPVLFNTVLTQVGSGISYSASTGIFTITDAGTYKVSWMVNPNLTASTITGFTVEVNGTAIARSDAYISEGQVTGEALITVTTVPTTVELVNASAAIVDYSTNATVDANIVITKV